MVLALAYDVYSEKPRTATGSLTMTPITTDGIPDILWEAKTGADFIYKLYKAFRRRTGSSPSTTFIIPSP